MTKVSTHVAYKAQFAYDSDEEGRPDTAGNTTITVLKCGHSLTVRTEDLLDFVAQVYVWHRISDSLDNADWRQLLDMMAVPYSRRSF